MSRHSTGRDALDVGVDQIGQALEVDGAAGGAESGPGRERLDRRADGELGRLGVAARDLGQQRPVERRVILERPGACHPPPADEVVDGDVGPGDARARVLGRECRHQSAARRSPSLDWSSTV